MDLLRWQSRPQLRRPVLVAAFEGWNDAGNAASEAVSYLAKAWGAETFALFDSEELFDFTSSRPSVRIGPTEVRELEWPALKLSAADLPQMGHDVVFLSGPEPQLRWRSLADELGRVCAQLQVAQGVLLGALLADVPHTRPVRVTGGAATREMASLAGVEPSYYEGPTGIIGVVADTLNRLGVPTASLWASVPHYVSQSASPKAALALVERTARLLGVSIDTVELQISTAAYERQINDLVASDEDASAYVTRLEEQDAEEHEAAGGPAAGGPAASVPADEGPKLSPASGERLAAEVERYLREHPREP